MSAIAHTESLFDIFIAGLSFPPFSFVVAIIVAGCVLTATSFRAHTSRRRQLTFGAEVKQKYAAERGTCCAVAAGIIVLFFMDLALRGYVFTSINTIHWWRFATPLALAAIGLCAALAVITLRGSSPPLTAAISATPRAWHSFSSRAQLSLTGCAAVALLLTCLLAGAASSTDDQGRYVLNTLGVPNVPSELGSRFPFFGWTYSIPVMVCIGLLLLVCWSALRANAIRPYLSPETASQERDMRTQSASAITAITLAAILLTLATSWQMIAAAGSLHTLTVSSENGSTSYDMVNGFTGVAVAMGWCVPVWYISAFVLLIVTIAKSIRTRSAAAESAHKEMATL